MVTYLKKVYNYIKTNVLRVKTECIYVYNLPNKIIEKINDLDHKVSNIQDTIPTLSATPYKKVFASIQYTSDRNQIEQIKKRLEKLEPEQNKLHSDLKRLESRTTWLN